MRECCRRCAPESAQRCAVLRCAAAAMTVPSPAAPAATIPHWMDTNKAANQPNRLRHAAQQRNTNNKKEDTATVAMRTPSYWIPYPTCGTHRQTDRALCSQAPRCGTDAHPADAHSIATALRFAPRVVSASAHTPKGPGHLQTHGHTVQGRVINRNTSCNTAQKMKATKTTGQTWRWWR